jgi:hemolysin activation/secretion protein
MGRISYVAPVGSLGTKLGASYSRMDYTVGKDFTNLRAHGTAEVGSVYALHPFVRTRNFNLFGIVGADRKRLKDYVDFQNSTDDKSLRILNGGFSGDFSDNVWGGSLNTFSLTFAGGDVDLRTPLIRAQDQSGYNVLGKYSKFNYSFQRQQALPRNLSLFVSLDGQAASKNLVSSEQFSLGGPNAVRAYPVSEAVADEGIVVNAELRWNLPQSPFMLSGFVDYGHARLHKTPSTADLGSATFRNYRNVLGYGLGLNVGKQDNYLVRTSIAWRSDRKDNAPVTDTADRSPRAWVQFTKWF